MLHLSVEGETKKDEDKEVGTQGGSGKQPVKQ